MSVSMIRDDIEFEPEAEGHGDPPRLTGSAFRGLPPKRKRLAEFQAWRLGVDAEIAKLEHGKATLEARIAKAESAARKTESRISAAADGIIAKLKQGLAANFAAVVPPTGPDGGTLVAREALAKLVVELASMRALQAVLEARQGEFLHAALR